MKKFSFYPVLFITLLVCALGGCKKDDIPVDNTLEYKGQTDDQLLISAEIDAVTIDANTIVEATDYFFQRNTTASGLCDGSFTVDSTSSSKIITINYDGTNCAGKVKRKGQVIISMQKNQKWSDASAVLNISYKELQITRISDNKGITLNGELSLTNASGGRLAELATRDIVHIIQSSSMQVRFADGIQRTWQLAVKRTFSFDNGLVITSTGNHAEGSKKGISAWGVTHAGRNFTTMIAEPMIIRQDCYFRITSAKLVQEQGDTLTIIFGLDEKGAPVSCPAGNYYLQVCCGEKNATKPFILPY